MSVTHEDSLHIKLHNMMLDIRESVDSLSRDGADAQSVGCRIDSLYTLYIHLHYILYCIKYNSYTYISLVMAFNLYAMIMLILCTVSIMCIA